MNYDLCIYHGNCADGYTAAWVALKAGVKDFCPGTYGKEPPDVTGKHVLMVDFSYKRDILLRMAESAASITILDHHKTAQAELTGFPEAAMSGLLDKNISASFDMSKSGARMAWDFFFPDQDRPPLIDYVEDRDLWKFDLPGSREVSAYIFSFDYTFENWDILDLQLRHRMSDQVMPGGVAIERKHHKDIRELLKLTKRQMVIGGHIMWVANLPYTLASDAANALASESEPAAGATYFDRNDGQRIFSLRSIGDFDVSAIAKRYGGGGHRNAAGFQTSEPFGRRADGTLVVYGDDFLDAEG